MVLIQGSIIKYYDNSGNEISSYDINENILKPNSISLKPDPNSSDDGYIYRNGKYLYREFKDFGGLEGLTINNYYEYKIGKTRGVYIDLSYTSPETKGAKWSQFVITTIPGYGQTKNKFWDSNDGSNYYPYQKFNGNTGYFQDSPGREESNAEWEGVIFLRKNSRDLFILYYGFKIQNGNFFVYDLKLIYP